MDKEKVIEQGREGFKLRRDRIIGNPYEPYNPKYFWWDEGFMLEFNEKVKRTVLQEGREAFKEGKDKVKDNPYKPDDDRYEIWRRGHEIEFWAGRQF